MRTFPGLASSPAPQAARPADVDRQELPMLAVSFQLSAVSPEHADLRDITSDFRPPTSDHGIPNSEFRNILAE
jgi:hypothetical protein